MDKIASIGSVDWEKFCKPLKIANLPRSKEVEETKEEQQTEEAIEEEPVKKTVPSPKQASLEQSTAETPEKVCHSF